MSQEEDNRLAEQGPLTQHEEHVPQELSEVEVEIQRQEQQELERHALAMKMLEWCKANRQALIEAELKPQLFYGQTMDFNFLSHEETLALMKIVNAGKWDKEYVGEAINYKAEVGGIVFRVYAGTPPPNCRIVEEEVFVPEHVEPAHTETRRKIVCNNE